MWRIAILLSCIPSVVHAELAVRWGGEQRPDASLAIDRFDGGTILQASLAVRSGEDAIHAQLALVVGTHATRPQDLAIPLVVSRGSKVVGMTVALGGGSTLTAHSKSIVEARGTYEEIVAREKDPALLEWKEPTRHGERLLLRVFPVRDGAPARVTIDFVFPPADRLRFDAGERPVVFATHHDGDLPELATDPAERASVDRWTSLLAEVTELGPRPLPREHEVLWPRAALKGGPVDPVFDRALGDLVTQHAVPLSHCYAYGVERDPTLSGRGELVLRVDRDGSVREARVNGDVAEDSDVRWCIADEALRWKLHPFDVPYTIRGPLNLR